MNTSAKKTTKPATTKASKTGGARRQLEQLRATAIEHEEAGRWGDAATAWDAIGTLTVATKKEKAEVAGRAAAARVRAENTLTIERTDDPAQPEQVTPVAEQPAAAQPPIDETAAAAPAKAKRARKAPEPKAPRARDPRLPAPGTPLRHSVRGEVKAEAVEQEDGTFLYAGTAYPSIHKAAFAAQKGLGMKNSGANGFRFFDLNPDGARPARTPRGRDQLAAVGKSWERYARAVGEAIAAAGTDQTKRGELLAAINPQVSAAMTLAASLAA